MGCYRAATDLVPSRCAVIGHSLQPIDSEAHMFQISQSVRKAATITAGVVGVMAAALTLALGPVDAAVPKGPFNCAMGPTVLPDDRWASCALLSADNCILGSTALPDDRWANCSSK